MAKVKFTALVRSLDVGSRRGPQGVSIELVSTGPPEEPDSFQGRLFDLYRSGKPVTVTIEAT